MDYYTVLGINKNASPDDVKKAYRKLAMQYHPDRGGDQKKFQEINEAYDTLKDPAKRQQYDNPQPRFSTSSMNNQGPSGFEDLFSTMFHQGRARRRPINENITIRLTINLLDVMKGNDFVTNYKLGSGKLETVSISIPKGAKNGDTIRYSGLGDDTVKQMPRGDLFVKLYLQEDKKFKRDGNNLKIVETIDMFDLLLGTSINIKSIDGGNIKLNIPRGTNPDTIFSVPGYGLPDYRTKQVGNLYVKIKTNIPKIHDPKFIARIRELKDEINLQS